MIASAQDVLERFGHLPAIEKKKVVEVILRESVDVDLPALSDDDLVLNAEALFLELDQREAEDGES